MRLLAYERWMADAVAGRQSIVRSRRVLWTERTFGAPGIELLAAGMVSVVIGELIGIAGVALLATTRPAASAIICLGVVVMLFGAVRFAQAAQAGRAFRRNRPMGDS
jgi:hypothetical protein